MNALELNDEDLKTYLEVIPKEFLQLLYTSSPNYAKKLKGFRPNKADKKLLVKTSYTIIRQEKDLGFAGKVSNYYSKLDEKIKEEQIKFEKEGFSQLMALSIGLNNSLTKELRYFYYKIENIDEITQSKIETNIENIELFTDFVYKRLQNEYDAKIDEINKKFSILEKALNGGIDVLTKLVEGYKTENNLLKNDLKSAKENLKSLIEEKTGIANEKINELINSSIKNERKSIDKMVEHQIQNEAVKKIQDQFDRLKNFMKKMSELMKNYSIKAIKNNDYIKDNEHISNIIDDVLCNTSSINDFYVLKEYLNEILYSPKPIIVSDKNKKILVDIVSSIMTGGNYFEVDAEEKCDFGQLIDELNTIASISGNKVIVLNNIINVQNYKVLFDYIQRRPSSEKFIFTIAYDKELKFMAPEVINDFNFFIGNPSLNKISSKYVYSFENDKKIPVPNQEFEKLLSSFNVKINNNKIINEKLYGILSYSLIPFIAINESLDAEVLISKIMDINIRSKCEAVIHD